MSTRGPHHASRNSELIVLARRLISLVHCDPNSGGRTRGCLTPESLKGICERRPCDRCARTTSLFKMSESSSSFISANATTSALGEEHLMHLVGMSSRLRLGEERRSNGGR